MAEHKSIFTPNAHLDLLLTVLFGVEVVFVMWDMYGKGLLLLFATMLFFTDAVVSRVKALSERAGRALGAALVRAGCADSNPLAGRVQMKKGTEQSWQIFVHAGFAALEAYILTEEPWYDAPSTCWVPHPYEQAATLRADVMVLYMLQLAVWMYTCIIHRFFDERRSDYFVMYLHHIVTIMLVAGSFSVGYLRIGLIVLWIHDVSDILVDALKMVNYLKLEGPRGYYASELAYLACVAGWGYWRLFQYPFRVLPGALLEPYRVAAPQPRFEDGLWGLWQLDLPGHFPLNILLFILLLLHIHWGHLFLMIGYRILTESAREASRREYEGDSDDESSAAHGGDASSDDAPASRPRALAPAPAPATAATPAPEPAPTTTTASTPAPATTPAPAPAPVPAASPASPPGAAPKPKRKGGAA